MTDRFNRCINVVLRNEGGLSNDLDDKGGLTKYGISQSQFPELDIRNLTIEKAKDIYYDKYWLPLFLEGLVDENAALQIFDMGVNAGIGRAARLAQKASGAFVDGVIGKATINAINASESFVEHYKWLRKQYYVSIAKGKNEKFLHGWLNRIENCKL